MRKFVVLLMCLILPFSLFAQGAAESGSADAEGKVIIFQSKVEITEALERAAEDFTAETGIEVEIWETTGDDYRAQLSLRLAGDEVPTIFTVAAGSEAEMFAPYIAPIEDSEVNQYISPSLALMVNGKSSGVPYSVEGYGLVINKDMVSEADLENDETFLAALDRLASEGVNPFGLSQESYFLIGHLLNAPFAIMEDPEGFLADFEAGNVHLADQEEFQAFAVLMDKIKEVAVNPLEVNYDRECGDFATGKTAMIHQGNWCYSMFSSYDTDVDMALVGVPLLGNDRLSVSVPYYWVVNSQVSEADRQASIRFLDWLHTSQTGMDYILNEFLFVPAVSNIATDSLDPLSADVAEAAGSGETLIWTTNLWPMNIVDTDFAPLAQEFFTTDMTGIEFVERIEGAYLARL